MFWLILGEENNVYPLTATLSVNALDPHPPNVNLTLTVQWVGMDGFPYLSVFIRLHCGSAAFVIFL